MPNLDSSARELNFEYFEVLHDTLTMLDCSLWYSTLVEAYYIPERGLENEQTMAEFVLPA